MSHQTNSDFNYSQDGHTVQWFPVSAETTTSASESSFCGVCPIVITPDIDVDCAAGPASKESSVKEETGSKPLNTVPRNMMQFQVSEQQHVARNVRHTLFKNADAENPLIEVHLAPAPNMTSNQLSCVPTSSYPASGNQLHFVQVTSGNQIQMQSMVMSEADSVSQTSGQLAQHPTVLMPLGSRGIPAQCASGNAYLLQSFDSSTTSSGDLNTGPNVVVPGTGNQPCTAAPSVRLQTSRDISQRMLVPACSSGSVQPHQRFRKVTDIQQRDRILAPRVSLLQARPFLPAPYTYSQSTSSQRLNQPSGVTRVRQSVSKPQTQNISGFNKKQHQELPKSQTLPICRFAVDQKMQRQLGGCSEQSIADQASCRNRQQQESVQGRSGFSFYNQDPVRNLEMLADDVDDKEPVQKLLKGIDANFQSVQQVFHQSEMPPQSLYDDQNVHSQSLEGSQSMQQWAVQNDNLRPQGLLGSRNLQPLGQLEGQNLQPQHFMVAASQSRVGQNLQPVGGGQNLSLQGPGIARSLQTQGSMIGQTSQSQNLQPQNSLGGQTSLSQRSLCSENFVPHGSLGVQNFQPQSSIGGMNLQLQCSLGGQNLQEHSLLGGQNFQPQASLFGNTYQSQDLLSVQNVQPQSLVHGQNLQQQGSVGACITQNTDMNMQLQALLAAQQSPPKQLPRSVESHSGHLPSAQNLPTPESVSSNLQHQFNSLLSAQQAQNPTGMNLDHSLTGLSCNQNLELNQFMANQSLNGAMLQLLADPSFPVHQSLSVGSLTNPPALQGLPLQTCNAVAGMQNTETAVGNFPFSPAGAASYLVQSLLQQQMQQVQPQIQQQQVQQVQPQIQQQQVQQVQPQIQQQQQQMQQQQVQQVQPQIQQQQQQMQQQQQQMQQQHLQQVQQQQTMQQLQQVQPQMQQQQQQMQQQQMQQLQQQMQQQQLQQQLQQMMQQQQLLQQLQSNLGVLWPGMAAGFPNQAPLVNNAPSALPGNDLLSQLLPLMLGNLPPSTLLNLLCQTLPALSNPSLGHVNPFSTPQNQFQQQMASILAALIAPLLGSTGAQFMPSGLENNQLTSLLCQMLSSVNLPAQAPALPQPVLSQPGDGAAANDAMQMLLQNLSGPELSSSPVDHQFLQSLQSVLGSKLNGEASLSEGGSRPASNAGLGLEVSQQTQVPLSIDELSVQSLVEEAPTVASRPEKPNSRDVSPAKRKKHRPKGRSPQKKKHKKAADLKDKSADLHEDSDLTGHELKQKDVTDESDTNKYEDAAGGEVKDDDDAQDLNPRVYIDVAWDPNCSPTKTCSVKLFDVSERVIENGRRSLVKVQRKKAGAVLGRGMESVNEEPDGSLAVGRKRKGDAAEEAERSEKRKRLYSEEESACAVSDHLENATMADSLRKAKLKSLARGGRIAMLRSRGRGDRMALQSLRGQEVTGVTKRGESRVAGQVGKRRGGAFQGKTTSSSHGGGGNLPQKKGLLQKPQRKGEERASRPRSFENARKAEERAGHPRSFENARKAEETASHPESLDKDDTSNTGLSDDSSSASSPSGLMDSSSKTRMAEERACHPGSLDKGDSSKIGLSDDSSSSGSLSTLVASTSKTRMAEERARHPGSLDKDDSSKVNLSNDSSESSSSDLVESSSKGSQEQEREKNLLQYAKELATSSMPELSPVNVNLATKPDSKIETDQEKATEVLGVRKCRLKQMALATQSRPDSDSDNEPERYFSDSSSSGDFVSSRDTWKPKSKAWKRATSPGRRFQPKKKLAVSSKVEHHSLVAAAPENVQPTSDVLNISTEENETQRNPNSTERTDAESSKLIPFSAVYYARRGRGRPSLFQTFQTQLSTTSTTPATVESTLSSGRKSPSMPVLTKETAAVRAVARVSPLAPIGCDATLKEKLKQVKLSSNINERINSPLQTVFVKLEESTDTMNVLISFRTNDDNMVFQCTFCSFTDCSAKVVSEHVRRLHSALMFAATRTPMPPGDLIYLFCRHCSFVTHDRISMWIHFEISHGIADIVYGLDVEEVTPQATRRLVLNLDQQTILPSFYQCLGCEMAVADSRHIAEHTVKSHCDNHSCYRGCFAKARVINKPKSAPIQVTYRQLLGSEYVDQRKEVFICVCCSYVAYTEYLAISHHILSHLDLKMLFTCHIQGCGNQELSAEAAIHHMKADHADVSTRSLRGAVTLLLQLTSDASVLQECQMLNRKGGGNKNQTNLAQLVNSVKTTGLRVEKSASTTAGGNCVEAPEVESTSEDSTPQHQLNASIASEDTDKKKVKQTASKRGQK